jgi:ABC-type thiamin/hydroxymethylpyrimidine transport system permease subunit
MASKYYFSTRDLLVIAVLAALGGVLSTYVSYLANMINHLVGVPFGAGNVVAGLHVLWLLLMIAITRKMGAGLIGGAVKGFVEFITGNPHGIVVVAISTIEGLGAETGYWPFRQHRTLAYMLGGGLGAFANVLVFQVLYNSYGNIWLFGIWDGYRMARDMNIGNLPYSPTPKAKMAAFVVLPLFLLILAASIIVHPPPVIAPADCVNALTVPYDDLFRYNERYVNKTVQFTGEIEQVSKIPFANDEYVFRVSTRENEYIGYSGEVIWVNYKGPRYLEGDVIGVCGVVRGLKEYTAILGNSVMIPEIDAARVTLVSKSGSNQQGAAGLTI